MLLNVLLVIVILVVALLLLAAMRPGDFRVARRTRIDAPAQTVFPFIDDFRRWAAWSPWEKLDPQLTRRHSGAATGRGAVYEWEGNKKVGSGRMEIIESVPPSKVAIKLDFLKPWRASNTTEFALAASGGATDVTWTMHGPVPFMMKLMGIFMPMDKLVGKDFERGLANLKHAAETRNVAPDDPGR
jgi:uncharacterized protein YndB with AHSA1/START domain